MSEPGASPTHDDRAANTATRLHSAAIHLLRRLRREDDASGLSAPRLSALSVIVFGGPLSLGALAAAEQVRPPTMTRLVAALEAAGLVTREADPGDGRAILIRATSAGQRLLQEGRDRRTAVLARQLAALPPDDLATLERAAELLAGLGTTTSPGPSPTRGGVTCQQRSS
ncbi:MAG TPA: MarR family transcriptional regulator [Thermomicrobiales bacterium]